MGRLMLFKHGSAAKNFGDELRHDPSFFNSLPGTTQSPQPRAAKRFGTPLARPKNPTNLTQMLIEDRGL